MSGLLVVTLVHDSSMQGAKVKRRFERKAAELRPSGKYLWATLNASAEDADDIFSNRLPLLSSSFTSLPRIIVFSGRGGFRYWEDPSFFSIDNVTLTALDALLANAEALQDDTASGWYKEKHKMYYRFAKRDWMSMAI